MNPNSNTLDGQAYNFPEELDILYMAIGRQDYYPRRVTDRATNEKYTEYPPPGSEPYKGGMGGGERMPPSVLSAAARGRIIHTRIGVGALGVEHAGKPVCDEVRDQYFRTLKHLLDSETGHFSARHPNVGKEQKIGKAGVDAIRQAAGKVFQDGDLIWVEWDKQQERIVSLGWHYYYRWAYVDTVRLKDWREGRPGLFPLPDETTPDRTGAPIGLSPVRRLFGYTGDNKGSAGIGEGDHSQLMGRLSINTAIEVVNPGEADEIRFLPPIFLKELGQPRPSAVEHYLQQPHQPNRRPSDRARLASYGDAVGGAAAGYDEPGKLAGRKFYLDREGACASTPWNNAPWDDPRWGAAPWADFSETNRLNDRSTLALQASRPGRTFRFTVRFRDLDPSELAAVLAALCPNQFSEALGGAATGDYCSKLGYARPLGWGSVRIEAKKLLLLNTSREKPTLDPDDVYGRVEKFAETWPGLADWLAIHRRDHLEAGDYPTKNGQIYLYHTTLRGDHALDRRYDLKRRQNQPRS
jgi:CRISPR-associated protein (TIGR03986 family)